MQKLLIFCSGVARIFQKGGGVHKLCKSEGTHRIVMSFSPPDVGCLLKKGLQIGGDGTPGPPSYVPVLYLGIFLVNLQRDPSLLTLFLAVFFINI